jgi:hypothetical protein
MGIVALLGPIPNPIRPSDTVSQTPSSPSDVFLNRWKWTDINALTQRKRAMKRCHHEAANAFHTCYAGYQTCHEYRSSSQITVEWISQPVAQHFSKSLVRAQWSTDQQPITAQHRYGAELQGRGPQDCPLCRKHAGKALALSSRLLLLA